MHHFKSNQTPPPTITHRCHCAENCDVKLTKASDFQTQCKPFVTILTRQQVVSSRQLLKFRGKGASEKPTLGSPFWPCFMARRHGSNLKFTDLVLRNLLLGVKTRTRVCSTVKPSLLLLIVCACVTICCKLSRC